MNPLPWTYVAIVCAACGSSAIQTPRPQDEPSKPETTIATASVSATAVVTPASEPPPRSPLFKEREAKAAKAVEVGGEDYVDPRQAGLFAAHSLEEELHGLPGPLRKTLGAMASKRVDPKQRFAIVGAMLSEAPGDASLTDICGKPAHAVLAALRAKPESERLSAAISLCSLSVSEKVGRRTRADLHYMAVLLSVVTAELLKKRGDPTPSELAATEALMVITQDF